MIVNDLAHLPTATDTTTGEPPDPGPRYTHLLPPEPPATDPSSRLLVGDAGKCARAIGYRAARIPRSNPIDQPGRWASTLADLARRAWRDTFRAAHPDAQVGVRTRLDDIDATGWLDAIDDRTAITVNVAGGYAFKSRVGEHGDPEGPSLQHKLEGALNATAVGADQLVVGYLATEVISRAAAERRNIGEAGRYAAEWTYPRDVYGPWADTERARLAGIVALNDEGTLPARKIPGLPAGAVIVDPTIGRWEQHSRSGDLYNTGATWACSYCGWRDVCATTGHTRIPITDIPVTIGSAA